MRLMQHKQEAYWFYWYLSNFYDKLVNPLFWTPWMRDQSLELAVLNDPNLKVVDVGSGTGFTTEGIVARVPAQQVTCLDQSPQQMAKAKRKPALQGCTFLIGDAENLPFPTDHFDRYVSAGSIEYWPDPQRGIAESYRVIKPGGIALMIGPLEPENALGRWAANTWMLFPPEADYRRWYEQAGFTEISVRYIRPQWYRGKGQYGLAIAGRKPHPGPSPAAEAVAAPVPVEKITLGRRLQLIWRVVVGSTAGFVFIPAALWGYLRLLISPNRDGRPAPYQERLNGYQIGVLLVLLGLVLALLYWIIN